MRRAVIVASVAVAAVGVALLILHSGGGGSRTSTATPPPAKRILGPLHTDGKRLVGSNGTVRLLGLDEPGLVSGSGNNKLTNPDSCGDGYLPVPDKEFDDFRRLGFNSVRLGVSWANMEPDPPTAGRPAWNLQYLTAVDDAVRGFTSRGIAVVLDMHANNLSPAFKDPKPGRCEGSGLPVWLFPQPDATTPKSAECAFLKGGSWPGGPSDPQAGYAAAWSMLARRYASNELVVAADIFNEPSTAGCRDLDMLPFYRRVGTAIRAADPNLVLIYQDNAAHHGGYLLTSPLEMPNVVYSFHLYPLDWADGEPLLAAHLEHVSGWSQPVWIGEFGVFREKGRGQEPDPHWLPDLAAMMRYCRERGVGWAFHQYAGGRGSLVDADTRRLRVEWLRGLQGGF